MATKMLIKSTLYYKRSPFHKILRVGWPGKIGGGRKCQRTRLINSADRIKSMYLHLYIYIEHIEHIVQN